MRKILGEIFFYLSVLTCVFIFIALCFYNSKLEFLGIPIRVIMFLFFVFYIIYGVISHTLIITKENYKNKKLYALTRSLYVIVAVIPLFILGHPIHSKIFVGVIGIVFIAIMFINKGNVLKES
ncbi:hypothetical protein [Clostridium hydrogenum]|uniref:hypothetical protein n=1 Tax=Clostridium hydrogenum TaxID=2855764 RepID=UPI001F444C1D|nr:hypothetical protein [Clostridium hydrogenum]